MAGPVRLTRKLFAETFILAVVVFSAGFPRCVGAQETAVVLDPQNTKITFLLRATLHTVHGTFVLKRGEVRFDSSTGEATGSITLDATSAQTGNSSRDRTMHAEILESQKFPEIVFTAKRVKGLVASEGNSQVEVSGTFRLHGRDHEMTVPVSIDRGADGRFQADAHFAVPYVQWGLKNPSTFVLRVSDVVELEVHAEGKTSEATRPSP